MTVNFELLSAKFKPDEVEWRIGQSGNSEKGVWAKAFAYITNRAIMQRLDEACGAANWQCDFKPIEGGFLCGIGIFCGSPETGQYWAWKWDGSDKTDYEPTKGGISGAMKRAAVQWGIGRYLYDLDEGWCECSVDKQHGWNYQSRNNEKNIPAFYWLPPSLPDWALPAGFLAEAHRSQIQAGKETQKGMFDGPEPRAPAKPAEKKQYPKTACPKCGKDSTVRKSRKGDEGWYCWTKLTDEATGENGCGHQWGGTNDQKQENPFGDPVSQNELKASKPQQDKPVDNQSSIDAWARILLEAPSGAQDSAIMSVKKAIVGKKIATTHCYAILVRALELCQIPTDVTQKIEPTIQPLCNACFAPPMPKDLFMSFGELITAAEDRCTAQLELAMSGAAKEPVAPPPF